MPSALQLQDSRWTRSAASWMWVRHLQIATLHVGPILMSHWLTCFVMRFDAAGQCSEFTEYRVKRS